MKVFNKILVVIQLILIASLVFAQKPADLLGISFQNINPQSIKYIKVIFQSKSEGHRINDIGVDELYSFNAQNNIEKKVTHHKNFGKGVADSSFTYFYYNKQGVKTIERNFEKGQYTTTYFKTDSLGSIVKRIKCRETNKNLLAEEFVIDKQTILETEEWKYIYFDKNNHYKCIHLNDVGEPYKTEMVKKNKSGKVMSSLSSYVITNVQANFTFNYNEKGQLLDKTYYSNAMGDYTEKSMFKYQNDKLTEEIFVVNDKQKYQKFFFFNSSGIPESELKKYSSESMDILKYEY